MTLKPLGIDAATELVYRTLITHRDWGTEKIAESMQVPESYVHIALDRLTDLALVRQSLDNPKTLYPVDPQLGLVSLLQRRQAELHHKQQKLAETHASVTDMVASLRIATPGTEIDPVFGSDEIQQRIEALTGRASFECLALIASGTEKPEIFASDAPLNLVTLERRVAVRTIYLDSIRNDAPGYKTANRLTARGGEVRTRPTLPVSLLVIDREIALLPFDTDRGQIGAVELTTRSVLSIFARFFEHLWLSSTPLSTEQPRDYSGLSAPERELLALLSQGLTDEMAARRLGLSLRTIRRMMAGLMGRLGAKSRFEAGVCATERGWLARKPHMHA